jgi:hypothetical protein
MLRKDSDSFSTQFPDNRQQTRSLTLRVIRPTSHIKNLLKDLLKILEL